MAYALAMYYVAGLLCLYLPNISNQGGPFILSTHLLGIFCEWIRLKIKKSTNVE